MISPDQRSRRTLLCAVASGISSAVLAGCTDGTGEGDAESDRDDEGPTRLRTTPIHQTPSGKTSTRSNSRPTPTTGGSDVAQHRSTAKRTRSGLYEGREYEFIWTNADGDVHNFAIWEDGDEPLVSTAFVDTEGEETTTVVEAGSEMDVYLCETHEREMVGSLEVRAE